MCVFRQKTAQSPWKFTGTCKCRGSERHRRPSTLLGLKNMRIRVTVAKQTWSTKKDSRSLLSHMRSSCSFTSTDSSGLSYSFENANCRSDTNLLHLLLLELCKHVCLVRRWCMWRRMTAMTSLNNLREFLWLTSNTEGRKRRSPPSIELGLQSEVSVSILN